MTKNNMRKEKLRMELDKLDPSDDLAKYINEEIINLGELEISNKYVLRDKIQ